MTKHDRIWSLQEAKAKFSEVVRRAQTEGPQTVTVHGKPVVQVSPIGESRSEGEKVLSLVEILNACPAKELLGKIGKSRVYATPKKPQFP
jgi:antitoxin Phd